MAIPLDALGYRIYETAQWLFDDAAAASFFEGQMYEEELETIEVVGECALEGVEETVYDAVVDAVANAIESPETWIRSRLDDDFSYGWEDFAQTVQHESRFVFDPSRGAQVLVVTFIAMLELARERLIELTQAEAFAPIYVRLAYSPA